MRLNAIAAAAGLAAMMLADAASAADKTDAGPTFSVSFPKSRSAAPIDGRLLLLLSTDPSDEPRNQISLQPTSQIVFGETVDGLKPGEAVTVTASKAFGWPVTSLKDLKPGDYYVQALINRY